jgi:hypothetical protein
MKTIENIYQIYRVVKNYRELSEKSYGFLTCLYDFSILREGGCLNLDFYPEYWILLERRELYFFLFYY